MWRPPSVCCAVAPTPPGSQLAANPCCSEALTFGNVLDSPNRFPGHIIDTTYLGATVQYLLQLNGGPRMKISESNPQEIRLPGEDEVRVMAAMGDVVILRK